MPPPDLTALKTYLGQTSQSDDTLTGALATEKAAQSRVCRVPADDADWPADLAESLLRRVARNLAMRGIPLAMFSGDAELGGVVPPTRDPEVRRLEGPFRKLKLG